MGSMSLHALAADAWPPLPLLVAHAYLILLFLHIRNDQATLNSNTTSLNLYRKSSTSRTRISRRTAASAQGGFVRECWRRAAVSGYAASLGG
jgi:hypothetical protein